MIHPQVNTTGSFQSQPDVLVGSMGDLEQRCSFQRQISISLGQ